MNKSAYLDAMKITRWRVADHTVKPYQVLHDEELTDTSLLTAILAVLGVDLHACAFDCKPIKGSQVIWDMRQHKTRPRVAWVESVPLSHLGASALDKRQLWQQISAHLDKVNVM